MIYSIVSLNDIFYNPADYPAVQNNARSSNPYDYIGDGYFLDNMMNEGEKYVRFNSNFSSLRTGFYMDIPRK